MGRDTCHCTCVSNDPVFSLLRYTDSLPVVQVGWNRKTEIRYDGQVTNVMPPQPTPLGLTIPLNPTGHYFFETVYPSLCPFSYLIIVSMVFMPHLWAYNSQISISSLLYLSNT